MNKKKLLLVIEDNPLLTTMYKTAFEKEGLNINIAHNAKDGFLLLKKESPDLILLDILMPGMSGLEFLERIRKNKTNNHKVVVLSVLSDKETIEKAKQLGALEYLVKSQLNLSDIVARVIVHINS